MFLTLVLLKMGMSDPCSPISDSIVRFHDHVMLAVISIIVLVLVILTMSMYGKSFNLKGVGGETLETIWTVVPCAVLLGLASPSLVTLYAMDEAFDAAMTLKVIGHQWYWSYELDDKSSLGYDSYMVSTSELTEGGFRLLETTEVVCLPMGVSVRGYVTSSDVIHSWAVPSLGVKIDAVPGRLNQTVIISNKSSKTYGQCSEICGANHSFMPICLEFVPVTKF